MNPNPPSFKYSWWSRLIALVTKVSPILSFRSVVPLQDVFARVVQVSIPQDESQPAQLQILLVVALDRVSDEGKSDLVVQIGSTPPGCLRARSSGFHPPG